MARYTTAYSDFVRTLSEVEILRRFASDKEKKNPVKHRNEINALCRGSIVLLSGHLESFIKNIGEKALDSMYQKNVDRGNIVYNRLFYHISKNIIEEIKGTSDPDKIADKIFNLIKDDIMYWSRKGPFPEPIPTDRFNKGFSNPSFEHIRDYFKRFGYSDYKSDLVKILKAQFQPTINMVDHLVDTRNEIAHGNPTATKTPSDVTDMIYIIRIYCRTTDTVFASWWKSNYCSIR